MGPLDDKSGPFQVVQVLQDLVKLLATASSLPTENGSCTFVFLPELCQMCTLHPNLFSSK